MPAHWWRQALAAHGVRDGSLINESRRASLRQALLYARETFALMPAHWLRPGVVADIETFLDELARRPNTDRN